MRALRVLLLVALVPCLVGASVTTARVFELKHLRVGDAALLVQSLLSEDGSLTLEPRESRLTVQDREEVVERVARLLATLDLPPARYRVRAELYEATTEPEGGETRAGDLELGAVLRFNTFRRVGGAALEGEVGGAARAALGSGFVIRFRVEPADRRAVEIPATGTSPLVRAPDLPPRAQPEGASPDTSRVRLEELVLIRMVESRPTEILRSSVVLSVGQQAVVAASASESARRGLVLVLKAEPPGR